MKKSNTGSESYLATNAKPWMQGGSHCMPEGIVSQVRFEAWLGQHYLSHETIQASIDSSKGREGIASAGFISTTYRHNLSSIFEVS